MQKPNSASQKTYFIILVLVVIVAASVVYLQKRTTKQHVVVNQAIPTVTPTPNSQIVSTVNQPWKHYSGSMIELDYPSDWKLEELNNGQKIKIIKLATSLSIYLDGYSPMPDYSDTKVDRISKMNIGSSVADFNHYVSTVTLQNSAFATSNGRVKLVNYFLNEKYEQNDLEVIKRILKSIQQN